MQPNTKRTLQEDKTVASFFHQAENQETGKWTLKNLILIFCHDFIFILKPFIAINSHKTCI